MALTIDSLPVPVPSSTDPANFSQRGDATFGALPNLISQTNALASDQAANRDVVIQNKVDTQIAENNAANFALAASVSEANSLASSTAQLWVSGTTYSAGTVVYSPITASTYRRRTSGDGTTDPSLDSTNWYPVILDANTNWPAILPSLNLDFVNKEVLDPRITFTRASTGTYYDGITQAKADENLLTYSQDFSNAVWSKTSGTLVANSFSAPDSTTTASTFTATSGNAVLSQAYTADGTSQYTFSLYIYRKTGVGTVAITANAGTTWATQSITAGWNRFTVTATPTAGVSSVGIRLSTSGNEVYAWGAQLEQRSFSSQYVLTTNASVTSYVPVLKTAQNNQPRFDHNPNTAESKGLLFESSRENLLSYSNEFSNAVWVKGNAVISATSTISPEGTLNASKLVDNAVNTNHQLLRDISCTSGTTYSASIYLKAAERTFAIVLLTSTAFGVNALSINLLTGQSSITQGSFDNYSVTNVGAGWFMVSVTKTAVSTGTGQFDIRPAVGLTWNDRSYLGNGFSGIHVYGAQLEVGPFSTSYIPTTTTTGTRQADNAVMTGTNFSSWFNPSEGTMFADVQDYGFNSGTFGVFSLSSGTFSNGLHIFNASVSCVFNARVSSVDSAYISGVPTVSSNIRYKVSGAYKINDFARGLNGTLSLDNLGSLPTGINQAHIGRLANTVDQLNGHIRQIMYYPKRLSNQELQSITTL